MRVAEPIERGDFVFVEVLAKTFDKTLNRNVMQIAIFSFLCFGLRQAIREPFHTQLSN